MQTFQMYRRNVPDETHNENQKNDPNEPQFEGIVFSDGTVAVRWLTKIRSTSVWKNFDDLMAIHGHPEYESELVWNKVSQLISDKEKLNLGNIALLGHLADIRKITGANERIMLSELADWIKNELGGLTPRQLLEQRDSLLAQRDALLEAAQDMLSGWKYIRQNHGDLYGVGWDRAQSKVEAAIAAAKTSPSDEVK